MPDPDPSFVHGKILLKNGYDLVKLLGSGEMGFVFLCKDTQHHLVAIKASTISEKSRHELQMHSTVTNHPNVVSLHSHFCTQSYQYLVMDYLPGGNLLAMVSKKGALSIERARRFFGQLVSGLQYCHGLGIVHRDVKLENILLDEACENIFLTDWDLAGNWTPNGRLSKFCGSPHYAAPEVFKGIPYVGPELDVWSAGVVLFSILCGRFPFNGASTIDIAYRVQKGEIAFPAHVTDAQLMELVRALLTVDPLQRITVDAALAHPFMAAEEQYLSALRLTSHTRGISFADTSGSSSSSSAQQQLQNQNQQNQQPMAGKKRSSSVIYTKNTITPICEDSSVSTSESVTSTIGVSAARSKIFESRQKIHQSSRGRSETNEEPSSVAPSANPIQTRTRSHSIDVSSRHRLSSSSSSAAGSSARHQPRGSPSEQASPAKPPPSRSVSNLRTRDRRMTVDSGSSLHFSSPSTSSATAPSSSQQSSHSDNPLRKSRFSILKPSSWFKSKK